MLGWRLRIITNSGGDTETEKKAIPSQMVWSRVAWKAEWDQQIWKD